MSLHGYEFDFQEWLTELKGPYGVGGGMRCTECRSGVYQPLFVVHHYNCTVLYTRLLTRRGAARRGRWSALSSLSSVNAQQTAVVVAAAALLKSMQAA